MVLTIFKKYFKKCIGSGSLVSTLTCEEFRNCRSRLYNKINLNKLKSNDFFCTHQRIKTAEYIPPLQIWRQASTESDI